jgi:hypothetical protein
LQLCYYPVRSNAGSGSMDQKIIDLYDQFTHGGINRRSFSTG